MSEDRSVILIYMSVEGNTKIDVKMENETVWLTQKQIGELFEVDRSVVTKHIKNIFNSGELEEKSNVQKMHIANSDKPITIYNLDVIIAIGFRANSAVAIHFRQWANQRLKEYMIKGFVLDDERLKNRNNRYLDELVQRIREIRASELNFYQKIREIFKLSKDYDSNANQIHLFFANAQNKLLCAVTKQTSAEIIYNRVDHKKNNIGLATFKGSRVRTEDIYIAKNYLKENEIRDLEKLVVMFLDYVETQVQRTQQPIYTKDWEEKIDKFILFNEYNLLNGYGVKSKNEADAKAKTEYDTFDESRKKQEKIEADNEDLKEIENITKILKNRQTQTKNKK
jgi:hypothetical protein